MTTVHPGQKELLDRYKIKGLPTIIFLNTKGVEEKHLRIQELVSPSEVINRMKKALEASSLSAS